MSATTQAAAPQYVTRRIPLSNGATVDVSSLESGEIVFSIAGSTSVVQFGVCMSREQLAAIRDSINAVLVSTEPESISRATLEAAVHAGVLSPDALEV